MIKVYFAHFLTPLSEPLFKEYLSKLPLKLQEKTFKFKRWQDRHNFLFGKILLQNALKEYNYTLNDVKINLYKRPYIYGIDFNISHSENIVICAISEYSIGIDIEAIREIELNDFREFFKDEWQEIVSAKNPLERFYNYWTIKEATLKAYGSGFLENLNIKIDKDRAFFNNKTYYIQKLNIHKEYICHIVSTSVKEIELEEIKF